MRGLCEAPNPSSGSVPGTVALEPSSVEVGSPLTAVRRPADRDTDDRPTKNTETSEFTCQISSVLSHSSPDALLTARHGGGEFDESPDELPRGRWPRSETDRRQPVVDVRPSGVDVAQTGP